MDWGALIAIDLVGEALHFTQQVREVAAFRDVFGSVAAMLESVPIALRCTFGVAAVHPAPPIRHRRRLA